MKSKFWHLVLVLIYCMFNLVFASFWDLFFQQTERDTNQNRGYPEISQLWYLPSASLPGVYVIKGVHSGPSLSVQFSGDDIIVSRPIFKLQILCFARYPVKWIHNANANANSLNTEISPYFHASKLVIALFKKTFGYDDKLDQYNAQLELTDESHRSETNLTFRCGSSTNEHSYTIKHVYWPEFTPPTMEGSHVETITWKLGDSNKAIACKASGNPVPIYSWTHFTITGQIIKRSENCCPFAFVSQKKINTLEFEEIRIEMAGRYECNATNELGSVFKVFIVTIEGVPSTTSSTLTTAGITSRSVSTTFEFERSTVTAAAAKEISDLQKTNLNESISSIGFINYNFKTIAHMTIRSVMIVIMFGILLLFLICSGIFLVVLFVRKYRKEYSVRKLDQMSHFSLKEIGFHRTLAPNQLKI